MHIWVTLEVSVFFVYLAIIFLTLMKSRFTSIGVL